MDLHNDTPFEADIALGMGLERKPTLAVVLKATFRLPEHARQAVEPAEEQLPVATDDEHYDGDLFGSVRLEADDAPFKPRADVVVVGTAYAPGDRPVQEVDVSVRVGQMSKTIRVFGDREWLFASRMMMTPEASPPQPFTEMPLVYERAFGGMDHKAGKWCAENFIGRGFIGKKSKASVDGVPLPNLEDPRDLITSWKSTPTPVGFGFYRKDWQPRARHAGSLQGQDHLDESFGLPSDFSHDFYNAAHPDLQMPGYLNGDEKVELRHLTPDGRRRFHLPDLQPAIAVHLFTDGPLDEDADPPPSEERPTRTQPLDAPLDTLVFLPDEGVFYQVWRACCPIHDLSLQEIAGIEIQVRR